MNNSILDQIKELVNNIHSNHPYVVLINPEDFSTITSAYPGIEKVVLMQPSGVVDKGKCVVYNVTKYDLEYELLYNSDLLRNDQMIKVKFDSEK